MNNFEYAEPRTQREILTALADYPEESEILAGGTDLVGLLKQTVVTPRRVVNVMEVPELQTIERGADGELWIGAAVRLIDFLDSSLTDPYPAPKQALHNIGSIQRLSQGTIGGELCRRPACWYFRAGHGLLANNGQRVVEGDNRYHAILGNSGAAKFVNASRLAPSMIAMGARVRIIGPHDEDELLLPLEELYRTPQHDHERELSLEPGQVITHIVLPTETGSLSAVYEVRHGEGPDPPLTAAAVSLVVSAGIVRGATIVMGHVAPIPWVAHSAARQLIGQTLDATSAHETGWLAVADAQPLSHNEYKLQQAAASVERALLAAAGLNMGVI